MKIVKFCIRTRDVKNQTFLYGTFYNNSELHAVFEDKYKKDLKRQRRLYKPQNVKI